MNGMGNRMRVVLIVVIVGIVTAVGSALAWGAAMIRIGQEIGSIPQFAIAGFNFGNWMQVYDLQDKLSAIRIGILRFPAGNYGDEHDRSRTDLDFLKLQLSFLGDPSLIMQARLFGGVTGSGTPADAVAAADYARRIGLDIKYWEVGNEPDLYTTHRGDPSWTADKYCREFRRFAAALKEFDPSIKLAGPAISQGGTPTGDNWIRTFIRRCGDIVDLLTWHFYPTDGTESDRAALATSGRVSQQIARYRAWLKDPAINPAGHNRHIGLGITEFGLSWNTNNFRHLTDMIAGLWTADVLGQMAANGLTVGAYFALQDTGGHGLIDTAGWNRPTYWVFAMLKGFVGTAYAVRSPTDTLHAYAAFDGSHLRLLMINLATSPVEVPIDWGSFTPQRDGSRETLDDAVYKKTDRCTSAPFDPHGMIVVPARSVNMFVTAAERQ